MKPEHVEPIQKTVHPNEKGEASVVCTQCGQRLKLDRPENKDPNEAFRSIVSCDQCGCTYDVLVNFRHGGRKSTNLTGICTTLATDKTEDHDNFNNISGIIVENISKTGIGFTLKHLIDIKIGDTVKVKFVLNNNKKTVIDRTVVVQRIDNRFVGAKFTRPIDAGEKDLAFYLL
ncbi:MAG: PilZ domain-containing protein [Deltaproteobacteria bacterium]|nr:PilZ domain-containing protein [Deltaproteobacteria bacterium]